MDIHMFNNKNTEWLNIHMTTTPKENIKFFCSRKYNNNGDIFWYATFNLVNLEFKTPNLLSPLTNGAHLTNWGKWELIVGIQKHQMNRHLL